MFRKHGLLVKERKVRHGSGFDFRGLRSKTHTTLVSTIVAHGILTRKEYFIKLSDSKFITFIQKAVKKVSKWTPKRVHAILNM